MSKGCGVMIKEIIVVEGKDDITAVKAAVDAEIIATNGFGYGKKFIELLNNMSKRRGIIIFTDPDFMGEKIRRDIASRVPNCKHAFLPQDKTTKDGDIGIENASVEDILKALEKARVEVEEKSSFFNQQDLVMFNLIGSPDSKDLRDKLGEYLGIGYGNGKQFVSRLNSFGITREEFLEGIERIKK